MSKEKALVRKELSLLNEDWFFHLIEQIEATRIEKTNEAREIILEGKWEIGRLIHGEYGNFERKKIYGQKVAETIAESLGKSSGDVWACMRFYKKYQFDTYFNALKNLPPEIDKSKLTWYFVKQNLLGEKDSGKGRPRVIYKIDEILLAFKQWFHDYDKEADSNEVDNQADTFYKYLMKTKK